MENLVGTDSRVMNEIADKLSEVEVLYILASKPRNLVQLVTQLENTFGLQSTPIGVKVIVDDR